MKAEGGRRKAEVDLSKPWAEVMLRRLSAESMGGLQERLEAVQKACVKVRARFEKHSASGEGEA